VEIFEQYAQEAYFKYLKEKISEIREKNAENL